MLQNEDRIKGARSEEEFNLRKKIIERYEATESRIKQFRYSNGHHLGSVFAASREQARRTRTTSFHPDTECNMDWALSAYP